MRVTGKDGRPYNVHGLFVLLSVGRETDCRPVIVGPYINAAFFRRSPARNPLIVKRKAIRQHPPFLQFPDANLRQPFTYSTAGTGGWVGAEHHKSLSTFLPMHPPLIGITGSPRKENPAKAGPGCQGDVRYTPKSGHIRRQSKRSAFDPKRTSCGNPFQHLLKLLLKHSRASLSAVSS